MTDHDLQHILIYSYVDDMLERREAYRTEHLRRVILQRDEGHIHEAGAFDPPTGAAIVFMGVEREHVERFVADDPYYRNGLITSYRIERWNVIRGH